MAGDSAIIQRLTNEVFLDGNLTAIDELVADDFVDHDPPPGVSPDKAGFRQLAELVIAEAILLMRRIPQKNAECHRGGWSKSAAGSYEVRGKVLGIVGYGHIGTQVGLLAEGLGMRVVFHDIETKLALGNARAAASLDELLAQADVVTLHVPETPATPSCSIPR